MTQHPVTFRLRPEELVILRQAHTLAKIQGRTLKGTILQALREWIARQGEEENK